MRSLRIVFLAVPRVVQIHTTEGYDEHRLYGEQRAANYV